MVCELSGHTRYPTTDKTTPAVAAGITDAVWTVELMVNESATLS